MLLWLWCRSAVVALIRPLAWESPHATSAALKSKKIKIKNKKIKGSGVSLSCGIGHRSGLDPTLLRLWCRPTAAAPIQPLAWELPYAKGVALKGQKQNKTKSLL